MNELDRLARKYGTDKRTNDEGQTIFHGYTATYDQILSRNRLAIRHFSEIGVREGWSHRMWYDYFPNAMIYGIDNFSDVCYDTMDFDKSTLENDRIKIFISDATTEDSLKDFEGIELDVIVEDASHKGKDQKRIFDLWFPKVRKGGLYFIEDLGAFNTYNEVYEHVNKNPDVRLIQFVGELMIIFKKGV